MITKEKVKQIKHDLIFSEMTVNEIAAKFGVSKTSVNNINIGKSHSESHENYPLRDYTNHFFTDNEVAFIRQLAKDGYSAKQIHILLSRGSYSTISNIISGKTRSEKITYTKEPVLERRKQTFDLIATPHQELINQFTDTITFEDAVYIKLLGRFMAPLVDTITIFLPIIETEMIAYRNPIQTREDIETYLEWGGTSFKTIWFIKKVYNNSINNINEETIYYDLFPIERFKEIDENIDLTLVKEMVGVDTKENYRKSE